MYKRGVGIRETDWVGVWFGKTNSVGVDIFLYAEPRRRSELLHMWSSGWRRWWLPWVFIEPRFLNEKQPQKPHNKLKKSPNDVEGKKAASRTQTGGRERQSYI